MLPASDDALFYPFEVDDYVGWHGPFDPENPMNWPRWKRLGHVAWVSIIIFLVNVSSTMFAPGAGRLMADFHQTSSTIGTLTVSIFLLGLALGPLVISPFSELYGRLYVYHVSVAAYIAFILACAWSEDITSFLVFRFLAGCAGSSPLTISGGTVADVIPVEQRGMSMAMMAIGPILGPVVGPVAGGFVSQSLGWRWTYWIVAIAAVIWLVVAMIFMRETYARTLLERKAALLRKTTGNPALLVKGHEQLSPLVHLTNGLARPVKLLLFSPVVLLLSIYVALIFGLLFLCLSTYSTVFIKQYHFTIGTSGLAFLGQGTGMLTGLIMFGILSDKILKAKGAAGHNGRMTPEDRLPLMVYFAPVLPIGFFVYGWTVETNVHWMAPIIGTSFIGIGALFVMLPAQIYLVDAFGAEAASSALAANTLLRSLCGTLLPLAAPHLFGVRAGAITIL
ncbi:uncharacterized protein BP5553_03287 [Venustampulla echinocandica]|uniref:Major facilitator superfamily (MFS) profile domain-containing protein n=1 Tax=Venustampulla echinocandica TaxID=2656787 RepID=A0A370TTT9_9HELO|nr:uncharacterized protein BP5553_03287 [Venustampulla echinocandica]RDL38947.1 hypothetical protein BP5553_03287 [Venustampulla echinocandica]